jgi:hypothetical protein
MANVTLHSRIDASWPQGQSCYSPGNPEELAIIGIDLLIRELGIDAAHRFVGQHFERYFVQHAPPSSPAKGISEASHAG